MNSTYAGHTISTEERAPIEPGTFAIIGDRLHALHAGIWHPAPPTLVDQIAELIQAGSGCTEAQAKDYARRITDRSAPLDYSPWRHGGWYVGGVRYPDGACGCVSRNYPDKKWRIVCGRPYDETFPNRDAAARAEQAIALAEYTPERIEEEIAERRATMKAIQERDAIRPDANSTFRIVHKQTRQVWSSAYGWVWPGTKDEREATLYDSHDAAGPLPEQVRDVGEWQVKTDD